MSVSHDKVNRMVHDLRQIAHEVHNVRNQKQHHRNQYERHKQHVSHCHEKLRHHNGLSAQQKQHPNWSKHLHELRMNLEHEQRNQNQEMERLSNANAHIARVMSRFNALQAHVYTEYNRVLKMHVPENVKQMVNRVHHPQ